jgi:chromosome segregation ATPase
LAQTKIVALQDENSAHAQERQQAEEKWQRSGVIQTELQERLQARSEELANEKHGAGQLSEQLNSKINGLQLELAQKQQLADSRGAEVNDLRNNLNQLAEQLAQVESGQRQSAALLRDAQQSHAANQEEIAALNEAHRQQCQALESQVTQARGGADNLRLQAQELQRRLSAETDLLRNQLDEQRKSFEGAKTELTLAQAKIAALQDESATHERERQQAEENWQRSGNIQKELQERLQARSEELQAANTAADHLEEQLQSKLNELQLELAHKQLLADSRGAGS